MKTTSALSTKILRRCKEDPPTKSKIDYASHDEAATTGAEGQGIWWSIYKTKSIL